MNTKTKCLAIVSLVLISLTSPIRAEGPLSLKSDDAIASILGRMDKQSVELRLKSGEKIAGKLEQINPNLVYLTQLVGAEFFEAVVKIDDISAVVVRAKAK